MIKRSLLHATCVFGLMLAAGMTSDNLRAQGVVPGSGVKLAIEDFEDPNWTFDVNPPKSSYNLDKRVREPLGVSSNGILFESSKRGISEIMTRVTPPAGGSAGSTGALLMQSRYTGIPGRLSYTTQQDDVLIDFSEQMGDAIPVSWSPSAVMRIYMPPFEEWEAKSGCSFGMRCEVTGVGPDEPREGEKPRRTRRGLFGIFGNRRSRRNSRVRDSFYPSFFIQFNSKADGYEKDSAELIIRGSDSNQDYPARKIQETGWWTLGISFTPDGRAHYYASPGVDDLTTKDHIASHYPQSVHVEYFNSFYFNICNQDCGNWSTEWIVDDPTVYALKRYRLK